MVVRACFALRSAAARRDADPSRQESGGGFAVANVPISAASCRRPGPSVHRRSGRRGPEASSPDIRTACSMPTANPITAPMIVATPLVPSQ